MNPRLSFASIFCCIVCAGCVELPSGSARSASVEVLSNLPAARPGEFQVGSPLSCQNLTVYVLHGRDQSPGTTVVPLQDAMARHEAVVGEEGSVNELAIENVSPNIVYVQSGDVVKGGRQDRTIADDFVLTPGSGRVAIEAFCVESGRWEARGAEPSSAFSGSPSVLASKELKLAARRNADQGEVWAQVGRLQAGLSRTLHEPVNADASPSSLQLALENPRLRQWAGEYTHPLASAADNDSDVVGFAFAINGHLNSADAYASHALFRAEWPRLLEAAAIEAIAHLQDADLAPAPTEQAVAAALAEAEHGTPSGKRINGCTRLVTYDGPGALLFEMSDPRLPCNWVHRNYILKC